MKSLLPVKRPLLPGYPAWYCKLCEKPSEDSNWHPGPQNISTSMQITPKLLRLSWEGKINQSIYIDDLMQWQ